MSQYGSLVLLKDGTFERRKLGRVRTYTIYGEYRDEPNFRGEIVIEAAGNVDNIDFLPKPEKITVSPPRRNPEDCVMWALALSIYSVCMMAIGAEIHHKLMQFVH